MREKNVAGVFRGTGMPDRELLKLKIWNRGQIVNVSSEDANKKGENYLWIDGRIVAIWAIAICLHIDQWNLSAVKLPTVVVINRRIPVKERNMMVILTGFQSECAMFHGSASAIYTKMSLQPLQMEHSLRN
jgi:hypothetical protein